MPTRCAVLLFQRLTGKSPDNLEELREMALDLDEDELDDDEVAGEEEHSDHSPSDSEEEEASDHEQAGTSGEQD